MATATRSKAPSNLLANESYGLSWYSELEETSLIFFFFEGERVKYQNRYSDENVMYEICV
jgi:hypothetical protein